MKRKLRTIKILLCCLTLLISCQTVTSPQNKKGRIENDNLKKSFASIFNGSWVYKDYLEDISKTKSPTKSQHSLATIVELDIDSSKIMADSLEVGAPGIHEGGSFFVYFKSGNSNKSFPTSIVDYDAETNFYELSYSITNKDTELVISHYNKNKKLLDENRYRRITGNKEDPLQFMVNKLLFSGTYLITDTTGISINIRFTNDGEVTGLPGFEKYYILTDYVAEDKNSPDQVCFDIQTKNQKRHYQSV
jgi:hypothetical protein